MYETQTSSLKQVWKQAKKLLNKEEMEIKERQQDFMAS